MWSRAIPKAILGLTFLGIGVSFLRAAPLACISGSLASYISSPSCTVGSNVAYQDFSFQLLSSTNVQKPISASEITVTPEILSSGLEFSSNSLFQLAASQSVSVVISYQIMALGLSGVTSSLLSPVLTPLGSIAVDDNICLSCNFTPGSCVISTTGFNLSDSNSGPLQLTGSASFPSTSSQIDVEHCITLTGAAMAIMSSPENVQSIPPSPEPYTIILLGTGLLILVFRLRFNSKGAASQDPVQASCAVAESDRQP